MSARSAVRISLIGIALLLPALTAGVSVPASAAATCSWVVRPSPGPAAATLSAAAATSAKDVWAVGSYYTGSAYRTLIEHWNGTTWTVTPSPNPASGASTTNTLGGVVALSTGNAWAFGFYEKTTTSFRTLIEHWNGTTWSVVPSPNPGTGENTLLAGAARSASDIWAVGYQQKGTGPRRTLTEHYNGSSWSVVPSPNVGSGDGNMLFGAASASGGPVWAVGTDPVSFSQTLALRWNGSAWTTGKTANPGDGDRFLQAVTEPAKRYALAVGSYLKGQQVMALAERWTGSGWSLIPARSPAKYFNGLQAVAAARPGDAWAVGARRNSADPSVRFRTLAEHWNGTSWAVVTTPSPGSGDDWLYGAAAVPGGGYWAVGTTGSGALTEFHC